jgi:integrase/recombinase XerD
MAEMNPLRRRMIEDMQVRNLSPVTRRCYVHAVAKFARHFNRSPDRLGLAEIRAYQIHLTTTGISWAGFNVAVCALRFFYGVTLGRTAIVERIPYARKRQQLPVILSADEVVRFFAVVPNLKHRIALMTAYAAGLRVSEVVRLKLTDVDSSRMLIRVDHGKGGSDRYIMLSSQLLAVLRAYWRETRPAHWLFPGQDDSRPLDPSIAGRLPHRAGGGEARQAGHRPYPAPQLRHSSARSRHRHPHHPGAAWAPRSVDDRPLHAARRDDDRQHSQPIRPAEAGGSRPGLNRGGHARIRGGGHLPPPRRGLSPGARRPPQPGRASRHGGNRGVPHRAARRPCRRFHCPASFSRLRQRHRLPSDRINTVEVCYNRDEQRRDRQTVAGLRDACILRIIGWNVRHRSLRVDDDYSGIFARPDGANDNNVLGSWKFDFNFSPGKITDNIRASAILSFSAARKAATASSSRAVSLSRSPRRESAMPRLFWAIAQSNGTRSRVRG